MSHPRIMVSSSWFEAFWVSCVHWFWFWHCKYCIKRGLVPTVGWLCIGIYWGFVDGCGKTNVRDECPFGLDGPNGQVSYIIHVMTSAIGICLLYGIELYSYRDMHTKVHEWRLVLSGLNCFGCQSDPNGIRGVTKVVSEQVILRMSTNLCLSRVLLMDVLWATFISRRLRAFRSYFSSSFLDRAIEPKL